MFSIIHFKVLFGITFDKYQAEKNLLGEHIEFRFIDSFFDFSLLLNKNENFVAYPVHEEIIIDQNVFRIRFNGNFFEQNKTKFEVCVFNLNNFFDECERYIQEIKNMNLLYSNKENLKKHNILEKELISMFRYFNSTSEELFGQVVEISKLAKKKINEIQIFALQYRFHKINTIKACIKRKHVENIFSDFKTLLQKINTDLNYFRDIYVFKGRKLTVKKMKRKFILNFLLELKQKLENFYLLLEQNTL